MSRRPWSNRFDVAIALSFSVHVLLGLFFWNLSWEGPSATLSEAGGVTWLNLNPGGEGGGGEGGHGAPATEALGEGDAKSLPMTEAPEPAPPEAEAPKSERENGLPALQKAEKPQEPKKPRQKTQEPKTASPQPKALKKEEEPGAGIRGPGEGDGAGSGSGPGGGTGKGLGPGEGSGIGSGKGPGGSGPLGSGGSGQGGEANAVLAQIRNKIARAKRYPRQARSQGIEGTCGLHFAIRPDGSLEYVKLSKSSGHDLLDEEALATVRRAAPFPYYAGPIRFSLRFSLKDL